MRKPSFVLNRFPCGCVVERDQPVFVLRGLLECPWCGATFMAFEYSLWAQDEHEPFVIGHPVVLVCVNERLLEITGVCDDHETLLVRERAGAGSFHLNAEPDEITFLAN